MSYVSKMYYFRKSNSGGNRKEQPRNDKSSPRRQFLAEIRNVIAMFSMLVSTACIMSGSIAAAAPVEEDVLTVSVDGVWNQLDQNILKDSVGRNLIQTVSFELYDLQENALFAVLNNAPLEFTPGFKANAVELAVPTPNGDFERFAIVESPVMHPELAAKFPNIKTYRGYGLDQPAATIRLDYTDHGFHAQVLSPDGQYYVDPYFHLQTDLYMSYYKHDAINNRQNLHYTEAVYSDTGRYMYGHAGRDIFQQSSSGPVFPTSVSVGEIPKDNISPGTSSTLR